MADYLFTDLHLHSNLSDEDLCDETPQHILSKVQGYVSKYNAEHGENLSCCISITDHNSTLSAIEAQRLIKSGKYPNVRFINGCEFTIDLCEMNEVFGVEKTFSRCHLLVYNFDENNKELISYSRIAHKRFSNEDNIGLQVLASRRLICEKYKINIPFSEFDLIADLDINANYKKYFLAIVKNYFTKNGIEYDFNDVKLLTNTYLHNAYTYFEEATSKGRIKLSEAMKIAHDAGATISLAHPATINVSLNGLEKMLDECGRDGASEIAEIKKHTKNKRLALLQLNNNYVQVVLNKFLSLAQEVSGGIKIDAMEMFNGVNFDRRRDKAIRRVCEDKNLYVTAGSDYHGENFTTHKTIGNVFQQSFQRQYGIQNSRLQDRGLFVRITNMPFLDFNKTQQTNRTMPQFIDENMQPVKWHEIDELIDICLDKHRLSIESKKENEKKSYSMEIRENISNLTTIAEEFSDVLNKTLNFKTRRKMFYELDAFCFTILKAVKKLKKNVREHSDYYNVEDIKRLTTLLKEIHRKYFELLRLDHGIIDGLKASLQSKGEHRAPAMSKLATITIKESREPSK